MEGYGTCRKAFVGIHGLGHAQRLAHSESPNIMQESVQDICVLAEHDTVDYRERWGN